MDVPVDTAIDRTPFDTMFSADCVSPALVTSLVMLVWKSAAMWTDAAAKATAASPARPWTLSSMPPSSSRPPSAAVADFAPVFSALSPTAASDAAVLSAVPASPVKDVDMPSIATTRAPTSTVLPAASVPRFVTPVAASSAPSPASVPAVPSSVSDVARAPRFVAPSSAAVASVVMPPAISLALSPAPERPSVSDAEASETAVNVSVSASTFSCRPSTRVAKSSPASDAASKPSMSGSVTAERVTYISASCDAAMRTPLWMCAVPAGRQ